MLKVKDIHNLGLGGKAGGRSWRVLFRWVFFVRLKDKSA